MTGGEVSTAVGGFVAGLSIEDIPDTVRRKAKRLLLDSVGVGVAGSGDPLAGVLDRWLDVEPGLQAAAVIGGRRASARDAALVNGALMHVLEYDDMRWPGHGSSSVVPVVLALGERAQATGGMVVTALVAGLEIFGKLARHRGTPTHPGWHGTGISALPAAAAAAAKILQLDAAATGHALVLAAESGAGTTSSFGSMLAGLHAGHAANAGATAAELARSGVLANPGALEADDGFGQTYFSGGVDWRAVLGGLGLPFELDRAGPTIRRYAAGGPTQFAILNLMTILGDQRLDAGDIARVEVHLDPSALRILRFAWPANRYQAKLSIVFNLAAILLGQPPDAALSEAAPFGDPRLRQIQERIVVLPDRPGTVDRAEVVVRTVDGRMFREDRGVLPGSPRDPLSDEQVVAKFSSCVQDTVARPDAERFVDVVLGLDEDTGGEIWGAWRRVAAAPPRYTRGAR